MSSPAEQHAENAEDAAENGFVLGEPYSEERDVSASRYSRKSRDAFEALLADLRSGAFGANVLYLWENSRGSRRVSEWALLADLCAEAGVLIRITSQARSYDPRNGHDHKALIDDANDSEYESYKTSMRNRRTQRRIASEGKPTGRCPWGYVPVHDVKTGNLRTWEPDPERAPLVAELFTRIAAGHSFRGIARDWSERGVVAGTGRPFVPEHLRDMATRHSYAGLRNYKGEIITGRWAPLVAPELFWTVYRLVSDPSRRSSRSGRAVYPLTSIIRCGVCGGPMGPRKDKDQGPVYRCKVKGCTHAAMPGIDAEILGVMLDYLSRPEHHAELAAAGDDAPEVAEVRAELAQARAELADANNTEPETVAEARVFARLIETLTGKVAELEDRERELTTPSALLRLIPPDVVAAERWEVERWWEAAPVSAQREVARALLSPGFLGEVRIHRVASAYADVADRIEWWKGDGR